MIELQQKLLADRVRNDAFYAALKKVIKKGQTTVADIGSGTGFLSFLALQLGARECYLYESEPEMLELSRQLAHANKIKNCHFVEAHSVEVQNPVKVDVVVSEILGNFALEENIIESLNDAKRFLKPGGVILPRTVTQYVAPVVSPRIMEEIDVWGGVGYGIDLGLARKAALNNMYVYKIQKKDLLAEPRQGGAQKWDYIKLCARATSIRKGKAAWELPYDATVYGLALWWECEVIPGVNFSTSPLAPATHWDQVFLPLLTPLNVKKGEQLEATFDSDSRFEVGINVAWEARVKSQGKSVGPVISMDMRRGL